MEKEGSGMLRDMGRKGSGNSSRQRTSLRRAARKHGGKALLYKRNIPSVLFKLWVKSALSQGSLKRYDPPWNKMCIILNCVNISMKIEALVPY